MTIGKMDYEHVDVVANYFDVASNQIKELNQTLEALFNLLKSNALISKIAGSLLDQYLADLKPHVEKVSQMCARYGEILRTAKVNHQQKVDEARGLADNLNG